MKILFVNFNYSGVAGDATQLLFVIKGLQELGHKITFAITDGDNFYYDDEKSKKYSIIRKKLLASQNKIINIKGIDTLPIHCISPKFGMYCPDSSKIAKKIVSSFDVVHIHNWYYHLGMSFAKICSEQKIPFVISFYASLQKNAHKIKQSQKSLADLMYTKKLIKKANALHSAGDLETKEYIKWGANGKKIYRIDNGVTMDNFKIKKPSKIFQKLQINSKTKYILFLSRIDQKKGIEILMESFSKITKKHNDIILIIAGTGDQDYTEKIKKYSQELGIEHVVKFSGYVSEDEKLDLLNNAILFALTSHSDIHPIAVVDALTMGLPVLISKESDFPEIVEYRAGEIVENNIEDISQTLDSMLKDNKKLQIYSNNAKKLIDEKFLMKNQIKKYEKMYLDIIKK
jgi:glycosyltransferase involved in cell wall biosynthesis